MVFPAVHACRKAPEPVIIGAHAIVRFFRTDRRPSFFPLVLLAMVTALPASAQEPSFVPDWVKDAVFYQIFPERFANGDTANDPAGTQPWGGVPTPGNYFGGDLEGIIRRLDHLSSLGVSAIYLNPIFAANSNHKYNTTDYRSVDPHFGTEETFRRMVEACHARGIRVILDGVFNHTGTAFFAFADVKKNGAASPYADWYNIRSFPVAPASRPNYECWWGYGELPKLMTGTPAVREHLFAVTRKWMEFGIDGWRLDVPNEIPHPFWVEWRRLVKSINPDAYIVGEIWDDASAWLRGDQFDAVMNYRFQKACARFFAAGDMSVTGFDDSLARVRETTPGDVSWAMLNLIGSHDTERFLTAAGKDRPRTELAWLFQMTYVGAPMIYYGDEIGMEGGKDPGCRGTMVWEPERQDTALLRTMRSLVALRNGSAPLRRGTFDALLRDDTRRLYAYRRALGGESVVVAMNTGDRERSYALTLHPEDTGMTWSQSWSSATGGSAAGSAPMVFPDRLVLPAKSGVVFTGKRGR